MRQFREFDPIVRDVEDVRINVDVVNSMRIERKDALKLFLSFTKVYTNSCQPHCVGERPRHFTMLVVQCASPHTHDPGAHREEIFRQESLAEVQLMVGRRSERIQCIDLEELDERM